MFCAGSLHSMKALSLAVSWFDGRYTQKKLSVYDKSHVPEIVQLVVEKLGD